jgi:16S rRNA (cytosine1402-N4)-methyltransferase
MEQVLHKTVLLHEAVDALHLTAGAVVVDATGGGGGHSERILQMVGPTGTLIVLDQDPDVVERLTERFKDSDARVYVRQSNFRNLESVLKELQISTVDAILADLGWNSMQFEEGGKGFSFQKDEPLHMTYGASKDYSFTARDIVNDWSEAVIADVLYAYADERYARRIARKIVEVRETHPIETSGELATRQDPSRNEDLPGAPDRSQ